MGAHACVICGACVCIHECALACTAFFLCSGDYEHVYAYVKIMCGSSGATYQGLSMTN